VTGHVGVHQQGGGGRLVGQRVLRREDLRLVTGRGTYVDDIKVPGILQVAFARSHAASGRITSIDVTSASAMEGVVAVLTADDLNDLVREWWVDLEGPRTGSSRPFRLMAQGDVRFVGEPLAMVVARSRYIAEDAVDTIEVDIDPTRPVMDIEEAAHPGSPLVHEQRSSNVGGSLPDADHCSPRRSASTATRVFRWRRTGSSPAGTTSAKS
jgi:carbon-monoxide dehydrogenase large subunit